MPRPLHAEDVFSRDSLYSVVKMLGGWVHLLRAMWTSCVVTCLMTMCGIELRFTQLDVERDLSEGRRGHPR